MRTREDHHATVHHARSLLSRPDGGFNRPYDISLSYRGLKLARVSAASWGLLSAARGRFAAGGPSTYRLTPEACWTVVSFLGAGGSISAIIGSFGEAMKQPVQRRLAAILAADVAGYSRLMGADEEGTHERLKAHFGELVNPKIAEHRGRIVKNTGDGLLAEFPSVVDAVRCAAEVQRAMADRNAETVEDKRITFRVGINLGDVIAEPDDIYGDGVNVAARLEALAEPGGICISRVVRDQIRDKLPYPFEDKGEQSVKNIARSVRVFALRPEAVAELPATSVSTLAPRRPRIAPVTMVTAAVMALVISAVAWWVWPVTRSVQSPPSAFGSAEEGAPPASSALRPPVAPRLSIVVLPFTNLGNDPEQQYFADGITEDLTTDLSRISHMLVISRNTAFTYRTKPASTKEIGRQLGVRYVLEGSVQRSGNQVRVNAQLINAETDAHLWAERFDRDTSDIFALQNEITGRIANTLSLVMINAATARPTNNPDALDYIFRGRAASAKPPAPEKYEEAIAQFESALKLDPQSVEGKTLLAGTLAARVLDGMTRSGAVDMKRAEDLVGQVLAASPLSSGAHWAKGQLLRAQNRYDEAIPEYETVLSSNRNSAGALHALAQCKMLTGSIEETIPLEEQAIRLSPRDPLIGNLYDWMGRVHLLQSRTDEAIVWFERARSANPRHANAHVFLAAAYGLKGETERGAAELAEARRLRGEGSYSNIARLRTGGYWGVPKIRALYEATFFVGLRKAGVPEE
jgi:adenylate cyclase